MIKNRCFGRWDDCFSHFHSGEDVFGVQSSLQARLGGEAGVIEYLKNQLFLREKKIQNYVKRVENDIFRIEIGIFAFLLRALRDPCSIRE